MLATALIYNAFHLDRQGGSASPEDDASRIAAGADIRRQGRSVSRNALGTTRSTRGRWIGFSEDDGTGIAPGADIRRHGRDVSPNALRTTRSTSVCRRAPEQPVPVNIRKNRKNFPCTRPGKSTKSSSNVQPANAVIVNTRKVKRADRDRFCRSPEGSLYENNTSEHWKH
jgi:hypothetical protein